MIPDSNSPSLFIRKIYSLILRRLERTEVRKKLESATGNNCWIIKFLSENQDKDIFQKDLEDAFSIRRSTVSRNLLLMEQKGLIQRVSVPYDARLKKLVLTPKALEFHRMIQNDLQQNDAFLLRNFSPEEQETLLRLLNKLLRNLEESEMELECPGRAEKILDTMERKSLLHSQTQ